jgi:hypothetical protein
METARRVAQDIIHFSYIFHLEHDKNFTNLWQTNENMMTKVNQDKDKI